jgi:hypothetical protein
MNRKLISLGVVLAALAICSFVTVAVAQQPKQEPKAGETKQPPKAEPKKEEPKKEAPKAEPPAAEKSFTGKLTDLHCFMTGAKDDAKAGECLKAGVPAVLEVGKDVYILSKGAKGAGEFAAMAGKEVEVKGKVFEKAGLKYIDVSAVTAKAGEKASDKKPEAKTEAKPEVKKPEVKAPEKKPEAKPEEKKPETKTK